MPIPTQRHLFDIPEDIAYLNCAYLSPLMHEVAEAGHKGLARKQRPWTIKRADFYAPVEAARGAFAKLVGASLDDIAIVSSTSYGTATAAANLPLARGQNIVVLAAQHASNVLIWMRKAEELGGELRTVMRPDDGDWTSAVLEQIDGPTAIAALPNVHWTDGGRLDLVAIGRRCREVGAAFVVDGTQSIGALPLDLAEVQPDFLVCSAYKWLLCPYTLGFLYAAPHRQDGKPIEEHGFSRAGAEKSEGRTGYTLEFECGARRYDMGERSNFINLPMAVVAIDRLLAWQVPEIAGTLSILVEHTAEQARERGYSCPPAAHRAPHILGFRSREGFELRHAQALSERGIEVSLRGGAIRVSPHLYNDLSEIDRLFTVLDELS